MANEILTALERNILNNIVEGYYHITSMVGTDVREAKELAQKVLKAFDPEPPVATLSFDGESEDITDRFDEMHRGWKALDDANDRIKVLEAKLTGKTVRMENLQAKLQQERDRRVEHRQQNKTLNEVVQRLERQLTKALAAYDAEVIGRREEVKKCHAEMGKLRADNEFLKRYYDTAEKNSVWMIGQLEKLDNACDLLEKWNLQAWQYDGDYEEQLQQDTCNLVVARELDRVVAKMQTPEAKAAAKALFTGEFGKEKP